MFVRKLCINISEFNINFKTKQKCIIDPFGFSDAMCIVSCLSDNKKCKYKICMCVVRWQAIKCSQLTIVDYVQQMTLPVCIEN